MARAPRHLELAGVFASAITPRRANSQDPDYSGMLDLLEHLGDVAAAHAEQLAADWGPDAAEDSLAKRLARSLYDTTPQIIGAGLTASIAYRFKTQFNENAKMPCFAAELPEFDHNEIVGFDGAAGGRFSAVLLDDSDLHPRVRTRIGLTQAALEPNAAVVERVQSIGETRVERLVSLVLLGDLVSLYTAILRGVDPGRVDALSNLKAALAEIDAPELAGT